jgi:penicillin-insensitive murein endopeptidase
MRCAAGLALVLSLLSGALASLPGVAEAQPRTDPAPAGEAGHRAEHGADHPAASTGSGKKAEKSSSGTKAKKSAAGKKAEKTAARRKAEKGDGARKTGKTGSRGAQSVGSPNSGRLVDGMRLRSTSHLALREGAHTWGLPALVRLLRDAGEQVGRKHSGAVIFVGDMSARNGGPIVSHNSHQSGRDVDVGFFITNSKGKPVNVKRFVAFDPDGRAREPSWARFDDARNWTLVEALLNDPAGVRYLFVSMGLRARLLAYAKRKGKSDAIIQRAAAAMMSPKDADLHDDHFHVRIGCPESMRGTCVEESGQRIMVASEKAGRDDVMAPGGDPKEAPASGRDAAPPASSPPPAPAINTPPAAAAPPAASPPAAAPPAAASPPAPGSAPAPVSAPAPLSPSTSSKPAAKQAPEIAHAHEPPSPF